MKRLVKRLALVVAVFSATALQFANAADWKMEPADSRLDFSTTFETAPAPGVFKDFEVRTNFDPQTLAAGRLDVTIKVATADMSSADINKAIASPEWFDFAKYPQAEFHATEIVRSGSRYLARGTLMLKGTQKPMEVPFDWTPLVDGATMDGTFVVKRASFGIGTGEWVSNDVIGPDVTIKFRVRLRKG